MTNAIARKTKGDDGGGIQDFAAGCLGLADEGVDVFGVAHEAPSEGKLVVAVIKDQRSTTGLFAILAPGGRSCRDLPRSFTSAGIALDTDRDRLADGAALDLLQRFDNRWMEQEILEDLDRLFRRFGSSH